MSKTNKFYEKLISKKSDPLSMLDNLYKPIKKNKKQNKTHFYTYNKNIVHQADLLFLPHDEGYKYALVIVDLHDRTTNAYPLKSKQGSEIIEGFEKIYNGPYLKKPKRLLVDAGNEFKGDVKDWLTKNKIAIKTALPGRHSQQGIIENKNLVIGKALLKRQTAQELITGQPSTEWIDEIPKVIKALNVKSKSIKEKNNSNIPVCNGDACILLEIGDIVRVALDEPRAADSNKKLSGKFRASDLRWEIKPRKITNIFLNPGMPPLYQVERKPTVSYTKNQLQLVNPNEKPPNNEYLNKKVKIEIKPKEEIKIKEKVKKINIPKKEQKIFSKIPTPVKQTKTRTIKKPKKFED